MSNVPLGEALFRMQTREVEERARKQAELVVKILPGTAARIAASVQERAPALLTEAAKDQTLCGVVLHFPIDEVLTLPKEIIALWYAITKIIRPWADSQRLALEIGDSPYPGIGISICFDQDPLSEFHNHRSVQL